MTATAVQNRTGDGSSNCPPWCVDHETFGDADLTGSAFRHNSELFEWSDRPGFGAMLQQTEDEPVYLYVSWGEESHQQADIGDSLWASSPGGGVTSDELLRLATAIGSASVALRIPDRTTTV